MKDVFSGISGNLAIDVSLIVILWQQHLQHIYSAESDDS